MKFSEADSADFGLTLLFSEFASIYTSEKCCFLWKLNFVSAEQPLE